MLAGYPPALLYALALLIGAAVGSFLTLITYRLPLDKPVGAVRSRCVQCGTALNYRDLVPVFSYLFARGKCRHCTGRVSLRYPLTEIACAAGAGFALYRYGVTLEAFAIAGLCWGIVAIFLTDLEHYIILDEVQVALALFGGLYAFETGVPIEAALGAAAAGVGLGLALKYGFLYFAEKDGLGMGDVKFLGVAGIWLSDAANFIPFLFFAGILGVLSALVWRALGHGERFPFGPSLALSLLLCVMFPKIANGFWQLYGLLP